MKKFVRILMLVLSYTPIATVAIAAQAKANELDGQAQNERVRENIQGARYRLLPPMQMSSSIDEAKIRYAELTGLEGVELESEMKKDIKALMDNGLLQINEKFIVSAGPSEHASSDK